MMEMDKKARTSPTGGSISHKLLHPSERRGKLRYWWFGCDAWGQTTYGGNCCCCKARRWERLPHATAYPRSWARLSLALSIDGAPND